MASPGPQSQQDPQYVQMRANKVREKLVKYCDALQLGSWTKNVAIQRCRDNYSIVIHDRFGTRCLAAAIVFCACREARNFQYLAHITKELKVQIAGALQALWYIEGRLRGASDQPELEVSYKDVTTVSESTGKSLRNGNVQLAWEGGPQMMLLATYNTYCPCLSEMREQRLSGLTAEQKQHPELQLPEEAMDADLKNVGTVRTGVFEGPSDVEFSDWDIIDWKECRSGVCVRPSAENGVKSSGWISTVRKGMFG